MNRLQANICLICVTLCWSMEVVLYACIPEGVPAFATSVPAVAYAYPDVNVKLFAYIVLGNSTIFPIVLGIPMAIIMQEELGFSPYIEGKQTKDN